MPRTPAETEIQKAAARWKDRCLAADGSVFTDRQLWTAENLGQLERYYVQNLDTGEGSFLDKLEQQLRPATPAAKQLAAEMLWMLYIIIYHESMSGTTKRLQIGRVWEWSGEALPDLPFELGTVLEKGLANPGTSYNTHRWRELVFFIKLMQEWKRLPADRQSDLLSDGWAFGAWLDGMELAKGRQFRHVLLYLLFPDQYDPMVAGHHKRDIVRKFLAHWGMSDEGIDYKHRLTIDRWIAKVRDGIAREFDNRDLDFYQPPLLAIWKLDKSATGPAPKLGEDEAWYNATFGSNVRTWMIGAGHAGRAWPEFQREEIIAIGWDYLGDLSEYDSADQIRVRISAEKGAENPYNDTLACWQFAHEMRPGDQVIAKRGRSQILGWGVIRSSYRYDPDRPEYHHVRSVEWQKTGSWDLEPGGRITNKTLTEVTRYKDWVHNTWDLIHSGTVVDPPAGDEPYTIHDVATEVFLEEEAIRSILDTLARRRNLILQGPPGVGKTFIARRLAYAAIGMKKRENVQIVQFHQSYAYEDFVQGWRPKASGGFELQSGVFYKFAERARARPDEEFVLIIDEINRGNLSKILGELMMLIEADKRREDYAVALTYSPDASFFVPGNLSIIGLMNTADRSLAIVDYALRRRFGFFTLKPEFDSIAFTNTLSEAGVDAGVIKKIQDRFRELNADIDADRRLGPGFRIGHSYFVPVDEDAALGEVWYRSIIENEISPLLEEYWFDEPDRAVQHRKRLLA